MTFQEQGRVVVLEPRGPLYEGAECDAMERALIELAEAGRRVVVDLSGAENVTARCLGILAHAEEIAARNGGRVVVCGASPHQRWLLARTGLGGPLGLADTRADAMNELDGLARMEG